MFAIFLATLRMKNDRGYELPMFATTSDHTPFRLSSPSYFPGLRNAVTTSALEAAEKSCKIPRLNIYA
jgi:hypothetical protein